MESLHIIKGLWNLSNIGAENSDTRIKLERDSLGRVVKEWQDAHWISSRYDEMGERIETTSSFGASILTRRNEIGQAAQVIAYMDKERPWEAAMEYNALGQETSRLVSGGVYSSWDADTVSGNGLEISEKNGVPAWASISAGYQLLLSPLLPWIAGR